MPAPDRSRALDHIVVALFENRSLDNVLGHLYGPGDGKTFDGVIGKDLSNPIPAWAEHGADRQVVRTPSPPIWIRRTRTRVRSTTTPIPPAHV
jgi:phospholipase C